MGVLGLHHQPMLPGVMAGGTSGLGSNEPMLLLLDMQGAVFNQGREEGAHYPAQDEGLPSKRQRLANTLGRAWQLGEPDLTAGAKPNSLGEPNFTTSTKPNFLQNHPRHPVQETQELRRSAHSHGLSSSAGDQGGRGKISRTSSSTKAKHKPPGPSTKQLTSMLGGTRQRCLGTSANLASLVRDKPNQDSDVEWMDTTFEPRVEPKHGSVSLAMKVAQSTNFENVVDKFRKQFFASSTIRSKECKRATILGLARAINHNRPVFPLSRELVEGVAAAMKEADMKSGVQYLAELRLMHVEAGHELPGWLRRSFDLCKKGLERHRGPTKRAAAVKIEDLNTATLSLKSFKKGEPSRPGLAFMWASLWMLREIELRNMRVSHVRINSMARTVSIQIPVSKCDQAGKGTRRTLSCCDATECAIFCPLAVARRILLGDKLKERFRSEWLFPSKWGRPSTKAGFIEAWKTVFGQDISGHSPRRSGAMFYVRLGLQLQELAFLGRWKSNIVLIYAEEALEDKPVKIGEAKQNQATPAIKLLRETESSLDPASMEKVIEKTAASIQDKLKTELAQIAQAQKVVTESTRPLVASFCDNKTLWVQTKGRGGKQRPIHMVFKATWNLPVSKWVTACGWNFADRSHDFSFVPNVLKDMIKCNKCLQNEKGATTSCEVEAGALK